MKRCLIVSLVTLCSAVMIMPSGAQAQTVNRVVSQYFRWTNNYSSTTNAATKVVYSRTFSVPSLSTGGPKYNVAYLSVHLVGDIFCLDSTSFCTARLGLACTLDGTANANACPNGNARTDESIGLPYVIFSETAGPGDPDFTNLSYTWCVPIKAAGPHTFNLFLASFLITGTSSLARAEAGMVNIDLAKLPSATACTAAPNL